MQKKSRAKKVKIEIVLEGIAASPGIVISPCFVYKEPVWEPEPQFIDPQKTKREIERFRKAIQVTRAYLENSYRETSKQYGKKLAEIIALQKNLLDDKYFLQEVEELIKTKYYDASYATFLVFRDKRELFLQSPDEYLRERAFDIQTLKRLVIKNLSGKDFQIKLKKNAILIAEDLSPTETIQLHRERVLGFATDSGGKNSHVAILARALSVPAVVGLINITELAETNDLIILDGSHGKVIINPSEENLKKYQRERKIFVSLEHELVKESILEPKTKDGRKINIFANIEFPEEIEYIKKLAVDGIGLFRTESIFLAKEALPSEDEQAQIYTEIAEQMHPLPVIIRTLDIGGDKIFPGIFSTHERNPFLGWRAIRLCLDQPEIFLVQLKAILRANHLGNVKIMIPMISCINEVWEAKKYLQIAKEQLVAEGQLFGGDIEMGIMVEIPSVVLLADEFAREVDFFSIGTNDLVQYTMAVDRANERVAKLYSHFNPGVLKLIQMTVDAARRNNIEVSMCGEMAGDPVALPILLAMGLENFSASHLMIPEIKRAVRELDMEECNELYHKIQNMKTHIQIKAELEHFYLQKFSKIFYM